VLSAATLDVFAASPHRHTIMPLLWMIAASLLFACMGVCVKLGADRFSAGELVFYRGFISLLLIWGGMRLVGLPLHTRHWRLHVTRSVSGFVSLVMYFVAISMIPLATAVTLNYTSPLFLALLLAFWQRERVRPLLLLATLAGFAGVVLLLRPTWQADQITGSLFGLGSGIISSIAYLHVRKLGEVGEPSWRTVFYFSLISTIAALPWMLTVSWFDAIDLPGALLLLGVGGFGALAQLCMTRAYKHGKTLAVASFAYSTVVFSSLFGYLLWEESLPLMALAGIALIIVSGVMATAFSRPTPPEHD
jgi:drug/metabolite transporter (DMT)-like permease